MADRVRVLTLNLRNLADRWDERVSLLLSEFAVLQPDLCGLQEVVYPMQQDRLLGASGAASYQIRRGWAGRPEYGSSILVRDGAAALDPRADGPDPLQPADRLDLEHNRCAVRAEMRLPSGSSLRFVTTHLHHLPADEDVRQRQTTRLVAWLEQLPPMATIVTGDFNAEPDEPAYATMLSAGFRSAFAEANGQEPAVTWPSGLQALAPDVEGDPGCLDYVWVRGELRSRAARLCFDRPAVDDPGLFPSDHFGVLAELEAG
jgi:endonuclease/exonuclease/phosphatase family metal-dependent hydrolase